MRILLREASDNALCAVEAVEVAYSPEDEELYVTGPGVDFTIHGVQEATAKQIIRDTYFSGINDLTAYEAIREDIDDDG